MAGYLVTRSDLDVLRSRTNALAGKLGIALPAPAGRSAEKRRLTGEDAPGAVLSRHTFRLFLTVYACTNVYENLLLGLLRRKRFGDFVRSLSSRSSAGFAAFIALYSLVFRSLKQRLHSRLGKYAAVSRESGDSRSTKASKQSVSRQMAVQVLESRSFATALAGVVASPALLLDPSPTRRVTMALYTLSRAIESSWNAMSQTGWLPEALTQNHWWFGPHLLFAFANAQLLHAFVYDPDCFPDSYSKFILRFSEGYIPQRPARLPAGAPWPEPRQLVDLVASTSSSKRPYPKFESPLLRPGAAIERTAATATVQPVLELAHPLHRRLVCATLHPDEPVCTKVAILFARREFVRAARFMGIISAIRLLFSWRRAKQAPLQALLKASKFSVGGGAAVASCIGFAWSSICLFQSFLSPYVLPTRRFYLQGFLAGLFVLLSPARSADLGMYSARLAVMSAWQVAQKRGRVRAWRNGEVIVFGTGAAILMAIHQEGPPKTIGGLVKRVLDRVSPNEDDEPGKRT